MQRRLRPILLGAALIWPSAPSLSAGIHPDLPMAVNSGQISPADAFAWSLLGVLGLTLGLITACGFGIYRHFRHVRPESELLEKIKQAARHQPPGLPLSAPSAQSAPWERPAEWWKDDPQD